MLCSGFAQVKMKHDKTPVEKFKTTYSLEQLPCFQDYMSHCTVSPISQNDRTKSKTKGQENNMLNSFLVC